MKEFILKEQEEVLAKFNDVTVMSNANNFKLSIVFTNERIILLKDVSKELLMNAFLSSRLIDIPKELEVVLEIPFFEIKELKFLNGTNKITFKDNNNEMDITCDDFKSFRIKLD